MDAAPPTPPAEVRPADAASPGNDAAPAATDPTSESPSPGNSPRDSENGGGLAEAPVRDPNRTPSPFSTPSSRLGAMNDQERSLCDRASRPDLVYVAGTLLLTAGATTFDTKYVKHNVKSPVLRVASSGLVGLTFGALLGGGVASLPKCSPEVVLRTGPEGAVASPWPLALSTALFAGIASPFFVAITKGTDPTSWEVRERSLHVLVPAVTGFAGALLPYVPALAPRTWRAAHELSKVNVGPAPVGQGAFATFTTTF